MPSRAPAAAPPAVIAPPAPAPTVPVVVPVVTRAPEAPAPEPKKDELPDAVRALLRAIPRDIAGLPGTTPESYAKYLAARDAVESLVAGR